MLSLKRYFGASIFLYFFAPVAFSQIMGTPQVSPQDGGLAARWTNSLPVDAPPLSSAQEIQQLIDQQKFTEAQTKIQEKLAKEPNNIEIPFVQAQFYVTQDQPLKAIEVYENLIAEYPEVAEPYNNLGVILAQQNRLFEARNYLEQAMALRPHYATAEENFGDVLIAMANESYNDAANDSKNPVNQARMKQKHQKLAALQLDFSVLH